MLTLFHSNKIEILLERLIEVLDNTSPNDVFIPETVLVQHFGLGRWIADEMARRKGVAANLRFVLPASFLWELACKIIPGVPEKTGFERDPLTLKIWDSLPELLSQGLGDYLNSIANSEEGIDSLEGHRAKLASCPDFSEREAFALASLLSSAYDSYLVYRPDWLLAWERGEMLIPQEAPQELRWLGQVWCKLVGLQATQASPSRHRASVDAEFLGYLNSGEVDAATLPKQLNCFGVSFMPPQHLAIFQGMARHTEVNFFALSPCRYYWGDIVGEKKWLQVKKKLVLQGKDMELEHQQVGNPLLAHLARPAREFFDLLLSEEHLAESDRYEEPSTPGMLGIIQKDILNLTFPETNGNLEDLYDSHSMNDLLLDRSLQIHVAHSPLREVQILHDQLFNMLESQPQLQPRDIVVMVPNIDKYAPYIDAVFAGVPYKRQIPWTLFDSSTLLNHPLVNCLFELLTLSEGRYPVSEILNILAVPAVRAAFGIDNLQWSALRGLIRKAGIRWGLDAANRQNQSGVTFEQNSWWFGLKRLVLGYATGESQVSLCSVAPIEEVEGDLAVAVGKLAAFIEAIEDLGNRLGESISGEEWPEIIAQVFERFFRVETHEEAILSVLSSQILEFSENYALAGCSRPVPVFVVKQYLEHKLSTFPAGQSFLTGQVVFCNLVPMRAIPFSVICLLGMNDGEFPRIINRAQFDLLEHSSYRRGDRSEREVDRYLFLESLLSARKIFYLSYCGRDVRDNSQRLPSPVVSELIEYCERRFSRSLAERSELRSRLIVEHPLQPFSRRYFRSGGDDRIFSYAAEWVPQNAEDAPSSQTRESPVSPVSQQQSAEVEIGELQRFIVNPSKYFCCQVLRAVLDSESEIEDEEPLLESNLEKYLLTEQWLHSELFSGEDLRADTRGGRRQQLFAKWQATGEITPGPAGEIFADNLAADYEGMIEEIRAHVGRWLPERRFRLQLGDLSICGTSRGLFRVVDDGSKVGLCLYSQTPCDARFLLKGWVEHLALCFSGLLLPESATLLVSKKSLDRYSFVEPAQAENYLRQLIDVYRLGLVRPLCFFPKTSLGIYRALEGAEVPLSKVIRNEWKGQQGESRNRYISRFFSTQSVFPRVDSVCEEAEKMARLVFGPLTAHWEQLSTSRKARGAGDE